MEAFFNTALSTLQKINLKAFVGQDFEIQIKRDDLIDNLVSGNKWRKLKYNVEKALHLKAKGILTFGGAHSNHLIATAKACNKINLKAIGFVRGEELNQYANPTLKRCAELGMELIFLTREEYKMRNEKFYKDDIKLRLPNYYLVPEGGANYYGAIGCQEIIKELPKETTDIIVSAGTGTTAAGLILGAGSTQKVHVISALKGDWMEEEVAQLLKYITFDEETVEGLVDRSAFIYNAHRGGYAKVDDQLLDFTKAFFEEYKIKLDAIYTAKAMMWLIEEVKKGLFQPGQKIVFIHTGGVQGMSYLMKQKKINLF